ncbi:hypothetical protein [Peribacillus butanolivorans]|uniref:hypothetical protein n=1 Tax=Peribacillus butanolivorans TaxID=421767 RepID=UPI0013C2FF04|nr:hypothetical protein [Peribacillus butanolivorans]
MYMLHSHKMGTIHTEMHYLGMASQVFAGYLEFLQDSEQVQDTAYLHPLSFSTLCESE